MKWRFHHPPAARRHGNRGGGTRHLTFAEDRQEDGEHDEEGEEEVREERGVRHRLSSPEEVRPVLDEARAHEPQQGASGPKQKTNLGKVTTYLLRALIV